MQRNDITFATLVVDVDWSADLWLVFEAESPARDARRRIRPAPASAFDGAQEGFEVGIECRGLFEIDGVAGVRRYPEACVRQCRLQHQENIGEVKSPFGAGEAHRLELSDRIFDCIP